MKKLVIFDLDGTLLYTLEDLTDSVNYALNKLSLPNCSITQVRSYVGNGISKLMERAVGKNKNNVDFDNLLKIFKEHYKNNMYKKTQPYKGVLEMLGSLKKRGLKIAVVSNKFDKAVKELCFHYFQNLVDVAIGESENVLPKPSSDGVLMAINCFSLAKNDCIYVGDSEVDIQTANNAQIDCISVDWGYKDKTFLSDNGAKLIVSSCKNLMKEILK